MRTLCGPVGVWLTSPTGINSVSFRDVLHTPMSKLISSDLIRLRLGAVDSSHPADRKWPIMRILRDWHLVPSTLQGRTICIFGRRALQRNFPVSMLYAGIIGERKTESCSAAVAQQSRALTIAQTTLKSLLAFIYFSWLMHRTGHFDTWNWKPQHHRRN